MASTLELSPSKRLLDGFSRHVTVFTSYQEMLSKKYAHVKPNDIPRYNFGQIIVFLLSLKGKYKHLHSRLDISILLE